MVWVSGIYIYMCKNMYIYICSLFAYWFLKWLAYPWLVFGRSQLSHLLICAYISSFLWFIISLSHTISLGITVLLSSYMLEWAELVYFKRWSSFCGHKILRISSRLADHTPWNDSALVCVNQHNNPGKHITGLLDVHITNFLDIAKLLSNVETSYNS